jgi:hypothetical protein
MPAGSVQNPDPIYLKCLEKRRKTFETHPGLLKLATS